PGVPDPDASERVTLCAREVALNPKQPSNPIRRNKSFPRRVIALLGSAINLGCSSLIPFWNGRGCEGLTERASAVDRDDGSGGEGESRDDCSNRGTDLCGRGQPPQRSSSRLFIAPSLIERLYEFCIDQRRRYRNYPNARRERAGERLGHVVKRRLRGTINHIAPHGDVAGGRG